MGMLDPPDAVLTFDDYFLYLQNILKENALPSFLNDALRDAKSFLFLGVHFEKWNIQLLLRKIIPYSTREKRRLKYSLLKGLQNSEAFTFIARRLELDFEAIEPAVFLNELYKRKFEIKRCQIKTVNFSWISVPRIFNKISAN
jgi:SIR2-like protein